MESSRPRPYSGGLWTLFSWLRREERLSTDTITSVGSDNTTYSFDFLGPGHYPIPTLKLPSLGPPTDSYKKRIQDRNLRRQQECDLTLHRKYGLHKSEGTCNYNSFSFPSVHINRNPAGNRVRRATSEGGQRRAAYVAGKRRAPAPPGTLHLSSMTSAPRRPRKRPAPQPPVLRTNGLINKINMTEENSKENFSNVNADFINNGHLPNTTEKCKNIKNFKSPNKIHNEKSFIKQIFENRKRNSNIDPFPVKILPNISELDRQAAEIIRIQKLKIKEPNNNDPNVVENCSVETVQTVEGDTWFCTRCLKKFNASVTACVHCRYEDTMKAHRRTDASIVPNIKRNEFVDKDELKLMLKQMKDSFPKRPKHEVTRNISRINTNNSSNIKIGSLPSSPAASINLNNACIVPEEKRKSTDEPKKMPVTETALVTRTVVLMASGEGERKSLENTTKSLFLDTDEIKSKYPLDLSLEVKSSNDVKNKKIDTPLRLSSLLNPVYIPKTTDTPNQIKLSSKLEPTSQNEKSLFLLQPFVSTAVNMPESQKELKLYHVQEEPVLKNKSSMTSDTSHYLLSAPSGSGIIQTSPTPNIKTEIKHSDKPLVHHYKRRELITQLEQSIANGDEQAAADAAIKLAQLRLSCSVLSFSANIIANTVLNSNKEKDDNKQNKNENNGALPKFQTNNVIKSDNSTNKTENVFSEIQPNQKSNMIDIMSDVMEPSLAIPIINNTSKEKESKLITSKMDYPAPSVKNDFNINSTDLKKTRVTDNKISKCDKNSGECGYNMINLQKKVSPVSIIKTDIRKGEDDKSLSGTERKTNTPEVLIKNGNDLLQINVWVEDREAARGPVNLQVRRRALMAELRDEAERSLGLASPMQRWIVGRTLCSDDSTPLNELAGPDLDAPFYLCLVQSDKKINAPEIENRNETTQKDKSVKTSEVYKELVALDQHALITNTEPFDCEVCLEKCDVGEGVVLHDCVHSFCKGCLTDVVRHSEEPIVSCPSMGCNGVLQDREIRNLVPQQDYERWLARSLAAAESGTRNSFHCRTRDCTGWALCEPGVRQFPCPVCKRSNCVPCQTIHEGETCEQHRTKLQEAERATKSNQTDDSTRAFFEALISKGEALECPNCSALITKKWGCDWVKCSACKTEICWVTRGRRWGPGGRGDTSGGCRCGVDGKRCHPSCGYCH